MIQRWEKKRWTDERQELQKMIEDGLQCCKDARSQGRPDDPRAVEDILKERRRFMTYAGTGTTEPGGALPSAYAPESALLPPIPRANPNKPITPLVENPVSVSKLFT
jgi:hypothetical protein